MRISWTLLQKGAEYGLTLAEISKIWCREDYDDELRSKLERIVRHARNIADGMQKVKTKWRSESVDTNTILRKPKTRSRAYSENLGEEIDCNQVNEEVRTNELIVEEVKDDLVESKTYPRVYVSSSVYELETNSSLFGLNKGNDNLKLDNKLTKYHSEMEIMNEVDAADEEDNIRSPHFNPLKCIEGEENNPPKKGTETHSSFDSFNSGEDKLRTSKTSIENEWSGEKENLEEEEEWAQMEEAGTWKESMIRTMSSPALAELQVHYIYIYIYII